jgi:hypothetical protein
LRPVMLAEISLLFRIPRQSKLLLGDVEELSVDLESEWHRFVVAEALCGYW